LLEDEHQISEHNLDSVNRIEEFKEDLKKAEEIDDVVAQETAKEKIQDELDAVTERSAEHELSKEEDKPEELEESGVETDTGAENISKAFEDFGISREDLDSVEGFNELSEEQQILVAENLKHLALGHLEEVRAKIYEEMGTEASQKSFKRARLVWHALRRGGRMKKLGKEVYAESMDAGLGFHGEDLQSLVEAAKDGPGAKRLEDGSIQIQYATGFENLPEEQKASVERFNVIANEFSRMPREWKYAKEGSDERAKYEAKEVEFESSKDFIQELKESEENREAALLLESRMYQGHRLNQFYNANPEIEETLSTIKNGETWGEAFKRNVKERGVYMATGFATRHALTGVLSVAALPAAMATGGFVGYLRGRSTGKKDLVERDYLERHGGEKKGVEGRNINQIEHSTKQTQKLIEQIENAENISERAKLINQLERRISVNELKDDEGKLNYGDRTVAIGNVSRYINTMAEARATIMAGPPPSMSQMETNIFEGEDRNALPYWSKGDEWNTWVENKKTELISQGKSEEEAQEIADTRMIGMREFMKAEIVNRRLEEKLELADKQISEQDKEHIKQKAWKGARTGLIFGGVGAMIGNVISEAAAEEQISSEVEQVAEDIKQAIDAENAGDGIAESALNDRAEVEAAVYNEQNPTVPEEQVNEAVETTPNERAEVEAPRYNEQSPTAPETVSEDLYKFTAESGDNIWNRTEQMLEPLMEERGFDEVERTHFIDAIKDEVQKRANEGAKMGFEYKNEDGTININAIDVGKEYDLSSILNDSEFINRTAENAKSLSEGNYASISDNISLEQEVVDLPTEEASATAENADSVAPAEVVSEQVSDPDVVEEGGGKESIDTPTEESPQENSPAEELVDNTAEEKMAPNEKEVKLFMTQAEKEAFLEERTSAYMKHVENKPQNVQDAYKSRALEHAEADWERHRNDELIKELIDKKVIEPKDSGQYLIQEELGKIEGVDIPEDLQEKYEIKLMSDDGAYSHEVGSGEAPVRNPEVSEEMVGKVVDKEYAQPFMSYEGQREWIANKTAEYRARGGNEARMSSSLARKDFETMRKEAFLDEAGYQPDDKIEIKDGTLTVKGEVVPNEVAGRYYSREMNLSENYEAASEAKRVRIEEMEREYAKKFEAHKAEKNAYEEKVLMKESEIANEVNSTESIPPDASTNEEKNMPRVETLDHRVEQEVKVSDGSKGKIKVVNYEHIEDLEATPATSEQLGDAEFLRNEKLSTKDYEKLATMYNSEYGKIQRKLQEIFSSDHHEQQRLYRQQAVEQERVNEILHQQQQRAWEARSSSQNKSGLSKVWGEMRAGAAESKAQKLTQASHEHMNEKYNHGFWHEWESSKYPIKKMRVEDITDESFTKLLQKDVNSIERANRSEFSEYVKDMTKNVPNHANENIQNYLYRVAAIRGVGK
jgi:hypothetical protein